MVRNTGKNLGLSPVLLGFVLLGTVSVPATILAQDATSGRRLPLQRVAPSAAKAKAQAAASSTQDADAPTYNYTLISYPGTLNTLGVGINPGAIHWPGEKPGIEIVGAEFYPDGLSQTGFRAHAAQTHGFVEDYRSVNDPNAPTPQQAYSINDFGQFVGDYIDAKGIFHSYEYDCDHFKMFDVPFAGATGTYSPAINNAGEIVGSWNDSAGNAHGYTLVAGKFVSFDYPGAAQAQFYYGINSEGDITGSYADSSGNDHGFLRKGDTYTQIDFPGASNTFPSGINDAGEIVGAYCPNSASQCPVTGEGELGFILKGGVFSTVTISGEFAYGLASINNEGIVMGNYVDAAGFVYTFLGTPTQ